MSTVEECLNNLGFFQEAEKEAKIGEIEACERFITKCWDKHRLHCFQEKRLSTALKDAYYLDKGLILFTYVENDRFSEDICLLLKQPKIKEVIRENFDMLGWDVSDNITQDSGCLPEAIASTFQDERVVNKLSSVVQKRKSAFFVVYKFLSQTRLYRLRTPVSQGSFLEVLEILMDLMHSTKQIRQFLFAKMVAQSKPSDSREFHTSIFNAFDLGLKERYQIFDCRNVEGLKKAIGFYMYWKEKFNGKESQAITDVYNNICRYSKYSKLKDMIEISFVFNCIEMEVKGVKMVKPYPLFVLKKCQGSKHPCRIFIDHASRVYTTWEQYIENNKFPSCTMVLPKNGVYQLGDDGSVLLETHVRKVGALSIADDIIKATFFASTLAFPCPLLAIPSAIYLIIRNVWDLFDRWSHSQDISIWNAEARSSYLYIVGCTFTIGYIAKILLETVKLCKEVLLLSSESHIWKLVPGVVAVHDVGVRIHEWVQTQDIKKMCDNVNSLEEKLAKHCGNVDKCTRICDEIREVLAKIGASDLPKDVTDCGEEIGELEFNSAKKEKPCEACGGCYLID